MVSCFAVGLGIMRSSFSDTYSTWTQNPCTSAARRVRWGCVLVVSLKQTTTRAQQLFGHLLNADAKSLHKQSSARAVGLCVGSCSEADYHKRNSAMDDSIGGS